MNKQKVIVLDKGESYKKLCQYYDGILLKDKINFLQFKNPTYLQACEKNQNKKRFKFCKSTEEWRVGKYF